MLSHLTLAIIDRRSPIVDERATSNALTAYECNGCHIHQVRAEERLTSWRIILTQIPAEPSRHRVAVWRELRKIGALSIGQGTWAVPNVPAFSAGIERARALVKRAGGEIIFLHASGATTEDGSRFEAIFTAAREDDWTEFLSDCAKYKAELDKEIRNRKFTLAELEEEDQSLDRLRRWHRDLKARDVFGANNSERATEELRECG